MTVRSGVISRGIRSQQADVNSMKIRDRAANMTDVGF